MNSHLRYVLPLLVSATLGVAQSTSGAAADSDTRARDIGRAFERYQEQLREFSSSRDAAPPWWKSTSSTSLPAATREKFARAQREFHDAVRGPLGAEPIPATGPDSRYAFLPPNKQAVAAQIDQLHNDRAMEVRRD